MPASATSPTAQPSPSLARSKPRSSDASSRSRPTKSERSRSMLKRWLVGPLRSPVRRKTSSGADRPRIGLVPIDSTETNWRALRSVTPEIAIPPFGARLSRRAAMCTTTPVTSKSVEKSVLTVRASSSPVWMPTLIGRPASPSARAVACIASAAQQARTAWSSWGIGAPNSAMTPSPCSLDDRALEAAGPHPSWPRWRARGAVRRLPGLAPRSHWSSPRRRRTGW